MSRRVTQNSQITASKIFSRPKLVWAKPILVLVVGSLLVFSGCRMADSSYDYCSPIFRGGEIYDREICDSAAYNPCAPLCDPLYRAGSIYYGRGVNGLTQPQNVTSETASDVPSSPNRSRVPSHSSSVPLPNLPRIVPSGALSGDTNPQERGFEPESPNGKARFTVPNLDRKIPPAATFPTRTNENPVSPINPPRERNDRIFDTKPIPPSPFEGAPFEVPPFLQNDSNTASENEDYGITLEALRKLDPTITDVKIMSVK